MKVVIALFALFTLGSAAPQPRKLFHEHVEDFFDIIVEDEAFVTEVNHLMSHYMEFDEFDAALEYLASTNFRDLAYEMESLPEFQAVIDFLEKDNIDIHFYVDNLNEMLESLVNQKIRQSRDNLSGTDFSAYLNDLIPALPKDKLAALFDQKLEEYHEFKSAIDYLWSEEWQSLYNALWENSIFQKEIATLEEKGIKMEVLVQGIKAIFGQN